MNLEIGIMIQFINTINLKKKATLKLKCWLIAFHYYKLKLYAFKMHWLSLNQIKISRFHLILDTS